MERRIAAILAADMVGFSRLVELDEAGTLARQKRHRLELIDPTIRDHHGRIIKLTGDGLIAEFNSVVEAMQAAVLVQRAMIAREAEVPEDRRIRYRIAINLGDVVFDEGDIYGDGVNIAARLEALAEPGGIVVSGTAHDMLKSRGEVGYRPLGEKRLKNISTPVRVFQVTDGPVAPHGGAVQGRFARPALVLLAAAVALGVLGWVWTRPDFTPVDPEEMALELPKKPSIAVLPFETRGEAGSQGWVADAITESVISTLSFSPDMLVIAHSTMNRYKNRQVNATDVARDLGVRYILSGSVLRSGETLRVTTELADAIKGQQIWSIREDSTMDDLLALQDGISQRVFEELSVSLTVGEGTRTWLERSGSFENYVAMVQGRAEFQKFSPEGHANAERLWGALYRKDPDRANTNYLMGWLFWQKLTLGLSNDPATDWQKAMDFSSHAIELEEYGDFYTLAAILTQIVGQHDEAIALADKAIALAPGSADANALGGLVKATSGQPREGLELMERGMRLEPDYPEWLPASVTYARLELGLYDEARKLAREVLASDMNDVRAKPQAQSVLVVAAVFEGDMAAARKEAKKLLEIFPQASAAYFRQIRAAHRDQSFLERYLDALVQAGILES